MTDLLVSYDIAKTLKKKGFTEPCLNYYINTGELCPETFKSIGISQGDYLFYDYNSFEEGDYYSFREKLEEHISAPLFQQALDWFMAKHKIFIRLNTVDGTEWYCDIWDFNNRVKNTAFSDYQVKLEVGNHSNPYDSYSIAIKEAFKLI